MKQGWEIKKLGEVCEVICGQDYKAVKDDNGKYPIYGTGGVMGYASQYRCPSNSVIIGRKGSINNPLFVETEFWNVDTAFGVVPNKEVLCPKFFFLFCKSFDFTRLDVSVTIPSLRRVDILQIPLPVPPLPVQEQIVSELDLLSGIIEKKREQLKELDALAQSIFYDMFGAPITNEKGWEVKKLGEVCKVNPSKKDTSIGLSNSDIVSFLPMEDLPIKACYHSPKQTRLFSEVQSSYTCFANNDVLMAKVTPCFENGKIGIASNLMNGIGYGSSEFIVIRANNIDVIKEYPYFVIQNTSFIENACAQLTGTSGLRRVPRQYVENCNISIPPLPLQHQFATKIEAIEKQKELIKQSISETETLFNARMQHYFN